MTEKAETVLDQCRVHSEYCYPVSKTWELGRFQNPRCGSWEFPKFQDAFCSQKIKLLLYSTEGLVITKATYCIGEIGKKIGKHRGDL